MPTPTPTPTPTPPATKIVGKPAVSTTFAATANLAAVDYDVGRAQSASGGPVAEASRVYDPGTNSFTLGRGSEEFLFNPAAEKIAAQNRLRLEKLGGDQNEQPNLEWVMLSDRPTEPQ